MYEPCQPRRRIQPWHRPGPGATIERMADTHDYGRAAERHAAELLEGDGWTILHRNWRWGHKEIDLVARRAGLVAFVEVRARRRARYGHPLETVTWSKRRDLAAAARAWIGRHGCAGDAYRFDVVWVLGAASRLAVHHEEGAWQL
jgi:putative endonuclease